MADGLSASSIASFRCCLRAPAAQQFLGFEQLGVGFQSLMRQLHGLVFETLGGHQSQAQQRAGVVLL
jgi:hypothetical protein